MDADGGRLNRDRPCESPGGDPLSPDADIRAMVMVARRALLERLGRYFVHDQYLRRQRWDERPSLVERLYEEAGGFDTWRLIERAKEEAERAGVPLDYFFAQEIMLMESKTWSARIAAGKKRAARPRLWGEEALLQLFTLLWADEAILVSARDACRSVAGSERFGRLLERLGSGRRGARRDAGTLYNLYRDASQAGDAMPGIAQLIRRAKELEDGAWLSEAESRHLYGLYRSEEFDLGAEWAERRFFRSDALDPAIGRALLGRFADKVEPKLQAWAVSRDRDERRRWVTLSGQRRSDPDRPVT
jgi:hypothetical protein